jgi:hypothetical protein
MSRLTQEGYGYRTISGSMPLKKRSQVRTPTTACMLPCHSLCPVFMQVAWT